ncbi:hypothetical protein ACI78R_07155 [Geodermatophilus sp. SYSU D01106]
MLIVLDEFGKALEHFAGQSVRDEEAATADLFVLQELAERASGATAAPVFLLTLQHLAFDDYVRAAPAAQRREWGKVQGRFEDVPFLETPEQSLRLVAVALNDATISAPFAAQRRQWAERSFECIAELGLANHIPGGAETIEHCYPLHPTALLALPELCARLGQHGRTLFAFLTGRERHTVADFLERTAVPAPGHELPTLKLHDLYDFFTGPGHSLALGVGGSRWREIDDRVREAQSIDADDQVALKTVGLLNLLGNSSGLHASAALVGYSLGRPDISSRFDVRDRLTSLEARGWVTYRAFADDYRLWQGSDVDLRGRVADAREQLRNTSPADLLNQLQDASPVIAAKHSQRVGMLRYFTVAYADAFRAWPTLEASSPADGQLIYFLGDPEQAKTMPGVSTDRPVIAVVSDRASDVRDAAIEVAAALSVLDQQDVVTDRVARRELQDRAADARARLRTAQAEAFAPTTEGVQYFRISPDGLADSLNAEHGLSRLLSTECDHAYPESPEIRNEMLGRRELTSQGAKARRNLLELMMTRPTEKALGMTHYGPERAMYEAVLKHTGLHGLTRDGSWTFSEPRESSNLVDIWRAIDRVVNPAAKASVGVDALYSVLKAPPIGIKDGPIPVLLAAWLLQRKDDVAVYEEGTFQPSLSADLFERMIKNPRRFRLKAFSASGARAKALAAIRQTASAAGLVQSASASRGIRNSSILTTAAPLLTFVRRLPDYTIHTRQLTQIAVAVRSALLGAREPDALLFQQLPAACGIAPLTTKTATADVEGFVKALGSALRELAGAYPKRLADNGVRLATELGLPQDLTKLRAELAARAEVLEDKVLDPRLRTFLFTARDNVLPDEAWLESIGLAIADRPPASWRQDDVDRFEVNLRSLIAAFRRVEALHFDAASRGSTDGFIARRFTQTRPNGTEATRVLYVDRAASEAVAEMADELLERAIKQFGPQGADALLQMIAEKVLEAPTADKMLQSAATPKLKMNGESAHG